MNKSKKIEFYRQAHSLVKKIRRRSIKKIEVYQNNDIYPGDFRVLSMLDSEKGTSIGDITRRWSMQYSNVTNTVNTLVKKGYAVKKKDEKDKRVALVYITPEGDEIRNLIFTEFDKKISECLENVSDEKITRALDAINDILEQL